MPLIGYQEKNKARHQDLSGGVKLIRKCVSDIPKRREGGTGRIKVLVQRGRERERETAAFPASRAGERQPPRLISFHFFSLSILPSDSLHARSSSFFGLAEACFARADSTSWQLKSSEGRGPPPPLSSGLYVLFSCLKRSAPCGGFVSVALSQRFETHHQPTTPTALSSTPS